MSYIKSLNCNAYEELTNLKQDISLVGIKCANLFRLINAVLNSEDKDEVTEKMIVIQKLAQEIENIIIGE